MSLYSRSVIRLQESGHIVMILLSALSLKRRSRTLPSTWCQSSPNLADSSSVIPIFQCPRVFISFAVLTLDYPAFVPHEQIQRYCEAYCEKFDLKKHIRFEHDVVGLQQSFNGTWQVTTKSAMGIQTWQFDKVLLAIGRHQNPVAKDRRTRRFPWFHSSRCQVLLICSSADTAINALSPTKGRMFWS